MLTGSIRSWKMCLASCKHCLKTSIPLPWSSCARSLESLVGTSLSAPSSDAPQSGSDRLPPVDLYNPYLIGRVLQNIPIKSGPVLGPVLGLLLCPATNTFRRLCQIQNLNNCYTTPNKNFRGGGIRQINTCCKIPLQFNFL